MIEIYQVILNISSICAGGLAVGNWSELISVYRDYSGASDELKVASTAQFIQESGRGQSDLAKLHLNYAGLKFRDRMRSFATPVDYTGSDGEETTYCKFASDLDFLKGYWHFIQSGPYQDWKKYKNDAADYIAYIAQAGYSADPNYVASVTNLFSEARTLLADSPAQSATDEHQAADGSAVTKPGWTDLKAAYLNTRHGPVLGIVLHDTAGTGKHNDTLYLANPGDGRKVSVDFTVERDGSIWKLNPNLKAYFCNHAGRATSWQGFKNAQVNAVTIGIEIVQKSDLSLMPIYTDAQVASVGRLCAWLSETYNIPNSSITTHRQIITDGSRSDPRKFPFETFWEEYWDALGKGHVFVASLSGGEVGGDEASEDSDFV